MKRLSLLVVLATVAFSAQAADAKIGVVRPNVLLSQSPLLKAQDQKFKAEFERRANELEARFKQFNDDAAKYQRNRPTMSPAEAAKVEKDLTARQIDLSADQRKFEEERSKRSGDLMAEVDKRITDVIEAVAKEKGLDAVLQSNLYAKPDVDITAEVLKRLK
jgi:outer membrane protein